MSKIFIFSQTTKIDSIVTVVYIHQLKVDYKVKVGENTPIFRSENLLMIDTLKFNPANYVFCKGLKRDYQKGEILFLLEKQNFLYNFLDRLVYTKKKLSKLLVDEDFKRKLLNYGINLDEIDPKLIVNNSL
ncbi:MAG: hypothetical protein ACK476_05080 [Fluviicola sp.]